MRIFLFLAVLFCHSLLAKETSILAIHSYHEAYPWTSEQHSGFREVLNGVPNFYPLYSTEYLDTKRRTLDREYENEIVHYMREKYKGYRPDVIYLTDDNALQFIINNRDKLFPGVPVVFSGINNHALMDRLPKDTYTGVLEEKDIIPNLGLIQQIFPSERELLLLGDGSSTADVIQANIRQHQSMVEGMNIRYLNDQSLDSVLSALKGYKGKNIILTTIGGFHSDNGNLIPLEKAIHKIANAGDFHIFSMEDTFIRQGVIGGYADDGSVQGREAAKILLQIIAHPKQPFPERIRNVNGWIFDSAALKQHNITLPEEIAEKSTFINHPATFYQKHEELITTIIYGLVAIIIMGSWLSMRYLYRSQKAIAERERDLVSISTSLNKAQELSHLGNWVWDIKANTLWWSNEIYRIFGLEPQEFKATYDAFLERVHPDDREAVQAAVNYTLTHQSDYSIVHRIIKMDGTIRRVHEEGSVDYEDGQPVRMNGTVQDITEAYEKEEALLFQAQMFDAVQDSIFVYDLEGRFSYFNENAWKTRGYTREEMMGMSVHDLDENCHAEKMKAMMNQMREVGHVKIRTEHLCKNGDRIPVEIYAKLITLDQKPYILSSIRDISEQLIAQSQIEKLSKAVEQIDDSVVITDEMGTITYVNQAFCDHTGFSREEALGNNPRMLKSGQYDQDFYTQLWKIILHGDVFRVTFVNRKKNGDLFYEDMTITPLKDENDSVTGFVSSGKDVTLETMMNKEMERIASIDKLTDIYNRHKFEELFILEAERSRRFLQPLSLILIDIDYFKRVNDTYGHEIGDKALIKLVKVVQNNIRKIDIFARWGGEEFLILSPGTDLENIQVLAEKLRLAVAEAKFPKVSHITISQGVSTFGENDTFSELFKRADKGLYYAKEHGRNQVGAITS